MTLAKQLKEKYAVKKAEEIQPSVDVAVPQIVKLSAIDIELKKEFVKAAIYLGCSESEAEDLFEQLQPQNTEQVPN